ncbi:MAG: hypothetical protein ACLRTA_01935 [Clostridia bacterium]
MSNITNLGGVTMNKEIFEYGGHHFIPEGSSPEKKMIFVISRRQRRDKELGFCKSGNGYESKYPYSPEDFYAVSPERSVTCSAVWKTESYICLVKMIYKSMWRQRNVNYQNQHDRKSE